MTTERISRPTPTHRFVEAGEEPSLTEVLADPLVLRVMQADTVRREDILALAARWRFQETERAR